MQFTQNVLHICTFGEKFCCFCWIGEHISLSYVYILLVYAVHVECIASH